MGRRSRVKGKVGELELAAELRRLFRVEARRGQQYSGSPDSPDVVVGIPGIHIECKRVESLRLYPAMAQAQADAGDNVPIVCHRKNSRDWLAVIRLDDLPRLSALLYLVMASDE